MTRTCGPATVNVLEEASCGVDMADVFVSYAKEDQAHVDLLSEQLEAKGYKIWYDTQLLPVMIGAPVCEKKLISREL